MPLVRKTSSGLFLDVQTQWTVVAEEDPLPASGIALVPVARWRRERDQLRQRSAPVGVWVTPATDAAVADWQDILGDDLFAVAIEFPAFGDGRGYSLAAVLRQRYAGDLWAVGDVLPDQIPAMARVGFDAFDVTAGTDIALIRTALARFSVVYQGAADGRQTAWTLRGVQKQGVQNTRIQKRGAQNEKRTP